PYSNAASMSAMLDLKPVSLRLDYSFYFGDAHAHRILPGISGNFRKRDFLGFDRITFYPAVYVLFGDEQITEIEIIRPSSINEALTNFQKYGDRFGYRITERRVFGIMNYAFSAPLNFTHRPLAVQHHLHLQHPTRTRRRAPDPEQQRLSLRQCSIQP